MTTEQVIVFGFIVVAFTAGWITRAVTEGAAQRTITSVARREGRLELEAAIRAYHAAVASRVRRADPAAEDDGLEVLAHALYGLSLAVAHASGELEFDHPLGERLRASGFELRRLAGDVMLHSTDREVPNGVFDQLEQQLMSAASTLLAPGKPLPI